MTRIQFNFGTVSLTAREFDTPTATAICAALPITGRVSTWGDEICFSTPVSVAPEPEARAVVDLGEIAYWPDGDAIAIGFGQTPISAPGEIRLASPCNIWAQAEGDVSALKSVPPGTSVTVSHTSG